MKLYTAFVCAVMMFTLSAHAGPAPREVVIVNDIGDPVLVSDTNGGGAAGSSHIEFLGFSMLPGVIGSEGLLAMQRACGPYGVGARMCTSVEIIETSGLVDQGPGSAWVRPFPISDAAPLLDTHRASFLDASGLHFSEEFANCNGWTYPTGVFPPGRNTLIVQGDFKFGFGDCGAIRPVACCGTAP